MMRKAANIYWLGVKELRSFLGDFVLLGLVAYAFSLAVALQARSNSQELNNASIAIVDEDHSELSRQIAHAFFPPLFQLPRLIAEQDIIPAMNAGKFTFVIDIPPELRTVRSGGTPARASGQRRCDRDDTGGPWLGLCAADHHHRDSGFPLACGGSKAIGGKSRMSELRLIRT